MDGRSYEKKRELFDQGDLDLRELAQICENVLGDVAFSAHDNGNDSFVVGVDIYNRKDDDGYNYLFYSKIRYDATAEMRTINKIRPFCGATQLFVHKKSTTQSDEIHSTITVKGDYRIGCQVIYRNANGDRAGKKEEAILNEFLSRLKQALCGSIFFAA